MTNNSLDSQQSLRRVDLMLRLTILSELILIASTWRLWFAATSFPRVPVAPFLTTLPAGVPAGAAAALIVCLIAALLSGWRQHRGPRFPLLLMAVAGGFLTVCLNQHCLQAWHWLFLLTLSLRLLLPVGDLLPVLQRLLPCIYIFAALSRFGPAIDTGMSPQIVRTLLDLTGLANLAANPQTLSRFCVGVSLTELLIGLLLVFPRTRRPGMAAAVVMHLVLLVVLGPWGLDQQMAVLVWNASLTVTIIVLYGGCQPQHQPSAPVRSTVATAFVFVWPALALVGITDNWTGWQLYSPPPEVLQVQVHADNVRQLPDELIPHVGDPQPLQDWCNVRLDRWSIDAVGVPLYPQARFQLAVAIAATSGVQEDDRVRATLNAPASPFWWNRVTTDWTSKTQLSEGLEACHLAAVHVPERRDTMARPTVSERDSWTTSGDQTVLDTFEEAAPGDDPLARVR